MDEKNGVSSTNFSKCQKSGPARTRDRMDAVITISPVSNEGVMLKDIGAPAPKLQRKGVAGRASFEALDRARARPRASRRRRRTSRRRGDTRRCAPSRSRCCSRRRPAASAASAIVGAGVVSRRASTASSSAIAGAIRCRAASTRRVAIARDGVVADRARAPPRSAVSTGAAASALKRAPRLERRADGPGPSARASASAARGAPPRRARADRARRRGDHLAQQRLGLARSPRRSWARPSASALRLVMPHGSSGARAAAA